MRFTAQEAYEAWQDGEPIMISIGAAAKICRAHGATIGDYVVEQENGSLATHYNAWSVLSWLGY